MAEDGSFAVVLVEDLRVGRAELEELHELGLDDLVRDARIRRADDRPLDARDVEGARRTRGGGVELSGGVSAQHAHTLEDGRPRRHVGRRQPGVARLGETYAQPLEVE